MWCGPHTHSAGSRNEPSSMVISSAITRASRSTFPPPVPNFVSRISNWMSSTPKVKPCPKPCGSAQKGCGSPKVTSPDFATHRQHNSALIKVRNDGAPACTYPAQLAAPCACRHRRSAWSCARATTPIARRRVMTRRRSERIGHYTSRPAGKIQLHTPHARRRCMLVLEYRRYTVLDLATSMRKAIIVYVAISRGQAICRLRCSAVGS